MKDQRLSLAAVSVLHAIAGRVRHGFDIMDATGLPSGTVYPILARLEKAALVVGRWEAPEQAQQEKRPARRYYEITGAGQATLTANIAHYRTLGGLFPADAAVPRPSSG
jgi:DNA-binding PadR family transcriptional regulator